MAFLRLLTSACALRTALRSAFHTRAPSRRHGLRHGIAIAGLAAGMAAGLAATATPARAEIASWLVFDADSGRVLEQRNAFRKWHPASLTKLMTAYITFDALRAGRLGLDSPVTVSSRAAKEPPSKMGFKPGTQLTVDNALKMVLVKSANDIAVALAETVGGSVEGFAALMNRQAAKLGMRESNFVNPHGLPDDRQIVSAFDMALLIQALLRDFPQYNEYYTHAGIRFGKKSLKSANREFLLRVRGANGLKTGYICDSGYNVAVSAKRGGRTLVAVILGASTGLERAAAARHLMEKGFASRPLIFTSGRTLQQLKRPAKARALPKDNYCKYAKKPSLDELLDRYAGGSGAATQAASAGSLPGVELSYAGRNNARLMPGATTATKQPKTAVKKKDGKIDWAKVMNRLLGPRIKSYKPIVVNVGVPRGATPVKEVTFPPLQDGVQVATGTTPLPEPKPGGTRSPVVGLPAAAPAAGKPSPGAILVLPKRAADGTPTPVARPAL